jgi:CDP-diacylglycerol---serine O-phosphatidyltransferase
MAHLHDGKSGRRFFFRRGKRKPLKYIAVLPALITLMNGISGFASVMFASKAVEVIAKGGTGDKYFVYAAYMILVAMVADMLDGRVARMSRTTSSFGGQLDSLCDVISFGVAPAFLAVKLLTSQIASVDISNPQFAEFLYRIVWLAGAVFLGCAAIRLARFNVENEEDESAHMSFWGLPSPAAAGVVMSLVILYMDLPTEKLLSGSAIDWGQRTIVILLPAVVIAAGLLMVSRFRYPHLVNQWIRGKKPFTTLLKVLVLIALVILCFEAVLTVVFVGFAISGPAKWAYYRFVARNSPHDELPRPVAGGDPGNKGGTAV